MVLHLAELTVPTLVGKTAGQTDDRLVANLDEMMAVKLVYC